MLYLVQRFCFGILTIVAGWLACGFLFSPTQFYIIPLAKKLKDCGVFGVSSDEYLQYAQKNRAEWEIRGQEIVASMMDKVVAHNDDDDSQRKLAYDTSDDEMED